MNPILYKTALKLVNDCSIPPHLSGFTFLSEAVVIKSENPTIKLKDLYCRIAENHHSTQRAITRGIAYAISQSDSIRDYLSVGRNDLFNGRVISMLAFKLKMICQEPA